jgi:hypothetical protein
MTIQVKVQIKVDVAACLWAKNEHAAREFAAAVVVP